MSPVCSFLPKLEQFWSFAIRDFCLSYFVWSLLRFWSSPPNCYFDHRTFSQEYFMLDKKNYQVFSGFRIKHSCLFRCAGLLRGDSVSDGDRHPGSPYPPNPSVVSEGHLPARICPQRPGPDEGQVSGHMAWILTFRQTQTHTVCKNRYKIWIYLHLYRSQPS